MGRPDAWMRHAAPDWGQKALLPLNDLISFYCTFHHHLCPNTSVGERRGGACGESIIIIIITTQAAVY